MPEHVTDTDCPDCSEAIWIVTQHGDQLVRCTGCQGWWWATYDADGESEIGEPGMQYRGGFSLRREEHCDHSPAAWRTCTRCVDAEGDLREHDAL